MPITIRHDIDPSIAAGAAYTAGKGQRFERDAERSDRMAMFIAQQRQRQQELEMSRAFDKERLAQSKELALAELGERERRFVQQLEFNKQIAKMNQEARLQEMALRNQGFLDSIALRSKLQEMQGPKYTPAQQKRLDELEAMREWVFEKVHTGEWTWDEAAQVLEQSEMEALGIKPPKRREEFDPETEFFSRVMIDPFTGERWLYNKDKWENITPKTKDPETQMQAQGILLKVKLDFFRLIMQPDPETGKIPTLEEAEEMWKLFIGEIFEKIEDKEEKIEDKEEKVLPEAQESTEVEQIRKSHLDLLTPKYRLKTWFKEHPEDINEEYLIQDIPVVFADEFDGLEPHQIKAKVIEIILREYPEWAKRYITATEEKDENEEEDDSIKRAITEDSIDIDKIKQITAEKKMKLEEEKREKEKAEIERINKEYDEKIEQFKRKERERLIELLNKNTDPEKVDEIIQEYEKRLKRGNEWYKKSRATRILWSKAFTKKNKGR